MDNVNQYSVVVLPKEAWEEIVKTFDLDEFLQKHRIKSRYE